MLMKPKSFQQTSYEEIDRHARNTPKWAEQSVQSLGAYLTEPAKNELQKARAVYRWMTHHINYDTKGFFGGSYGSLSPDDVLKRRCAVCDGYAGLFRALGQLAGLDVVKISGYSKGYHYSVGDSFSGPTNHAWNAAKINGRWRLLDATWGAGYLNEKGEFVRRFQEHYFLTPPDKFICDHFPENPLWQILDPPISIREFESLVYLKPAFFHSGLEVGSHSESVIKADEEVVITLRASDDSLLLAQLKQEHLELDKRFTFVQKFSGGYKIHVAFPRGGKYTLRLFAKQRREPGDYDWAMDYLIEAGKGMQGNIGFPETYSSFDEHDVYLYSPVKGRLKSGSTQKFKLRAPNAQEVAVVIDEKWSFLQKQGEVFEGNIDIRKGHLGVYARFAEGGQYSGLLKYMAS